MTALSAVKLEKPRAAEEERPQVMKLEVLFLTAESANEFSSGIIAVVRPIFPSLFLEEKLSLMIRILFLSKMVEIWLQFISCISGESGNTTPPNESKATEK